MRVSINITTGPERSVPGVKKYELSSLSFRAERPVDHALIRNTYCLSFLLWRKTKSSRTTPPSLIVFILIAAGTSYSQPFVPPPPPPWSAMLHVPNGMSRAHETISFFFWHKKVDFLLNKVHDYQSQVLLWTFILLLNFSKRECFQFARFNSSAYHNC